MLLGVLELTGSCRTRTCTASGYLGKALKTVLGLVAKKVGSRGMRYLPDQQESYRDTIRSFLPDKYVG